MSLDGSATRINFFKNTRYSDDVKALFGGGGDLEIYHDGANSKILNNTGDLKIGVANTLAIQNNAYDENIASFIKNGAVNLYYDSAKKLETTATGIQVTDEVSIGTSIIHTGDTDTKISFGTDEIVLTTAGADAVKVDSAGNVGIGTATPTGLLHLSGISQTGNKNPFKIDNDTNNNKFSINSISGDYKLQFKNAGNTIKVLLDSNGDSYLNGGNVGIGTASPSVELQVKGGAEVFRIEESSATGSPFMTFFQSGTRRSLIQHLDSGDLLSLVSEYGGIRFMTGTSGTEVERMRIDSSGDVGIGTVTPTAALQVVGLVEYADNAAALAAGLTAGAFYRTGDLLKVVH